MRNIKKAILVVSILGSALASACLGGIKLYKDSAQKSLAATISPTNSISTIILEPGVKLDEVSIEERPIKTTNISSNKWSYKTPSAGTPYEVRLVSGENLDYTVMGGVSRGGCGSYSPNK